MENWSKTWLLTFHPVKFQIGKSRDYAHPLIQENVFDEKELGVVTMKRQQKAHS